MRRLIPVWLFLLLGAVSTPAQGQPRWLPQAHAHNDYLHSRPLLDALDHGFCSVEADVFLVKGQLLVAHDPDQVQPDRTLESLYLRPLAARLRNKAGAPACPMTLLIDVKTEAEPAWNAIASVLEKYRDILTVFEKDKTRHGALTVYISGNRAASAMLSEKTRYAGLDGRLSDLDLGLKPTIMPLVSDDWARYFSWTGEGRIPPKDRDQLKFLVEKAHSRGYLIRFWNAPDKVSGWTLLKDAGVDFLNSDDLEGLSRFLGERKANE